MPSELVRAEVLKEPTPMELIGRMACDPSVDVAKLKELMDLQERVMARNARAEFWEAMARTATKLPRIAKNGNIPKGGGSSIPFATYEDIDKACRPLLAAEGISVSYSTRVAPTGALIMVLTVSHAGGHTETSERLAPPDPGPGRNGTQAQGSGESYAKRYLFNAFFNIVTIGADDDGRATGFISQQQADVIGDMIHEFGAKWTQTVQDRFFAFMGISKVAEINASDYQKAVTSLKAKAREWQ